MQEKRVKSFFLPVLIDLCQVIGGFHGYFWVYFDVFIMSC